MYTDLKCFERYEIHAQGQGALRMNKRDDFLT